MELKFYLQVLPAPTQDLPAPGRRAMLNVEPCKSDIISSVNVWGLYL